MESLGRTCLELSTSKYYYHLEKERGFSLNSNRGRNCFLVYQKTAKFRVALSVGFQHKHCFYSISASSSDTQETVESEEIQIPGDANQLKNVRVKFKLQKECAFGHKFLVVGDDTIFGSWDPSEGVPLDWSDGHVWTTELILPSGKMIKYKIILQEKTGTILWQPGPDRILETWDTEKVITVSEHWDNLELRNIVEEEADVKEESLVNLTENLSPTESDANSNGYPIAEDETLAPMVAEHDSSTSDEGSSGDLTNDEEKVASVLVNPSNLLTPEKEETLLNEGDPVLVPGLIPMPPEEIGEEEGIASESKSWIECVEELTKSQLKYEEYLSTSVDRSETIDKMIDDSQQSLNVRGLLDNRIVKTDVQWGRRVLQKFLATLGFQT